MGMRRPPACPSLPMSFFNIVAILGVFVFTSYAGASSIALADAGPGSASRAEQQQVAVAPREAVVGEDVSGLSEGQRAVEDMMQSMRNDWESESGWGWIPPQQPRKRNGDTVVKGMSPQERMVKMLQFDFAPLVEDILLSNAQRLAAVAAVAPDVAEDSSAGKTPPITKSIDGNSSRDAANQSTNLESDQVAKKAMKASEEKEASGGVTSPVASGAGVSAKTKEMTAQVTADIVRHLLRRADIAPNVSDSEMAVTTERELEAMEREKQQATSPAPTPLGQVIRKVARVTADLVKKMQKRNAKAKHGKRHVQQQKDQPTTKTQSTESHAAQAAVVAAAASASLSRGCSSKDTDSSKDGESSPKDGESSTLGKKNRGSDLLAANSDILEKISLRRDADPVAKDKSDTTFVQKWGESVLFPEPSKTNKGRNSVATFAGDSGKVIPTGLEWSAPGEVKLIEIKADADEKRPERFAEVLEMDDTKNPADSDIEWLRFAYESPLMKEAAPLNERNKRKLDGNLFEESLKDMGGEIQDRASAIQDNRINLMERNAVFPTIEETLKDIVERAIQENLLSAERSFLSDIGVNESGSGPTKDNDETENKSDNLQKMNQLNVSLVKDKREENVLSNKTVSGNANTKGQPHKEPRLLEIKGAYWRVPEKENGVTLSSNTAHTGDPLKLKRQTKDKVSDTSSNLSENDTKTLLRDRTLDPLADSEAPPSSSESANSSEDRPPRRDSSLSDGFSLKETAEKDISPFETNVSHERPLEKPKRDDDKQDIGKENVHSPPGKELDDSKLDGIEKTEVPDKSGLDLATKDKDAADTSETLHISTADKAVDDSKNTEPASEEEGTGNSSSSTAQAREEDVVDADTPREGEGGGGGGGGEEGDEATALADTTDDQINDTAATSEYRQGYGRASTKSLLCYQCRSDKMSDCGVSEPPKKWLKECKFDDPPERPVCRLIKREIDTSSGKKDLVLRMCGSSPANPDGGCYESLWGQQTTCECLTNACNGAISALKRAASLSSSKTLMQGEEKEFQSSGTNSVPWSLIYAAMPLGTVLASRSAFVY